MSADIDLNELKKKVDEIHIALLGTFDSQGVISRLRLLEDRANIINKIMIAIATAVLALVVNALKALLT